MLAEASSALTAIRLRPLVVGPWVLAGVAAAVLARLAMLRHEAFATGRNDLEIYTQVAWNLANGAPFSSTLLRTNSLHLGEHLALAMLPIAPLYGQSPDPRLLLVLQTLALILAALLVAH
jgi:uncharacterized membrane protein